MSLVTSADYSFVSPCNEDCYKVTGGDVPIPFGANRQVELADGEVYVLFGTIRYAPSFFTKSKSVPYLEVDLDAHPWLANERRKLFPYYPFILTGNQKLKVGTGVRVKVQARARAFIVIDKQNSHKYLLGLEPIEIN